MKSTKRGAPAPMRPLTTLKSDIPLSGILPVGKSIGCSSFFLVRLLRKLTNVSKIGHAGTLDPLASGVMILLIGKAFTRKAPFFLTQDKDYLATVFLGSATDTYDQEGTVTDTSPLQPSLEDLQKALAFFQGDLQQIPPMYSAKKFQGKKLYELALKGVSVERAPCPVHVKTELIGYSYPFVQLFITCSKGTYVRSIAHELGLKLGCFAHLHALVRKRVGSFHLDDCVDQSKLLPGFNIKEHLRTL